MFIRYLRIARSYRQKYLAARTLSYSLRFVVLVGGIANPTLISSLISPSLENSEDCPSPAALVTSLIISVVVSISSGFMEVFGVSRKHQAYFSTITALRQEAFMFLALTGRYRKYKSHKRCWRKFMHNIEVINSTTISRDIQVGMNENMNARASASDQRPSPVVTNVVSVPENTHAQAGPVEAAGAPQKQGAGGFKLSGVLAVPEWSSSSSADSRHETDAVSISDSIKEVATQRHPPALETLVESDERGNAGRPNERRPSSAPLPVVIHVEGDMDHSECDYDYNCSGDTIDGCSGSEGRPSVSSSSSV